MNQSRKKHEMRWYIVDNFDENNHFVKQMNQLGKLESISFPKGIKIRPITRAKKQIRSLVNIVLANDPRWNVYPRPTEDIQDPAMQEMFEKTASRVSQWFSDLWYFLDVKDRVRELVTYGFKYNVGYLEVGADAEGNIFLDAYEPYEIWHEPGIKSLKETNILIKGVSRTIQYVKDAKGNDEEPELDDLGQPVLGPDGQPVMRPVPLYDPEQVKELKPEARFSLAEWKDIRLQQESHGVRKEISDPRIARVFLKEVWIRDGEHWDLITECQGKILREEHTGFTRLPLVAYKPFPGLLYSVSPYDDLIGLNQAIDIQVAMLEGYARTTAVARFLKQKMTKLTRVLNEHGEIIEYEGGSAAPQWLQPGQPPTATIGLIATLKDLMDEIGTAVVSFGKVPSGVKAAQALEMLKDIEYGSNQTPVDLLSSTLEEIAEIVIDLGDRYFKDPVTVYHMSEGKPDFFKLVSQDSIAAMNPGTDAIPLSSKHMVKVEIAAGAAYTEQGKRDTAMMLYDKKLISPEETLKTFKYSNVDEILDKVREWEARSTSIVETPEFKQLPAELRMAILDVVEGIRTVAQNPDQLPNAA